VTQVTLRTAMDTIRNQGIVTVMLQVNGAHHYETVKQQVLVSETGRFSAILGTLFLYQDRIPRKM
jgi:hypothetical protein